MNNGWCVYMHLQLQEILVYSTKYAKNISYVVVKEYISHRIYVLHYRYVGYIRT